MSQNKKKTGLIFFLPSTGQYHLLTRKERNAFSTHRTRYLKKACSIWIVSWNSNPDLPLYRI